MKIISQLKKLFSRKQPVSFKRTTDDRDWCTEYENNAIRKGFCCDCRASLFEGPSAGSGINIYCFQCGSRFCFMGIFGTMRINNACAYADEITNEQV